MANNQQLRKIGIGIDGHSTSGENRKRNVNTTMQWGDCEPLMCELMLPNEKFKVKGESLTRLAPVVLPCFGDIKYKTVSMFCPIEDIMPTFNAMMAGQKYSNGVTTFVPTSTPTITTNLLSCLPLIGSTMSIWTSEQLFNGGLQKLTSWKFYPLGSVKGDSLRNYLNGGSQHLSIRSSGWSQSTMLHMNANWLVGSEAVTPCFIPIANTLGDGRYFLELPQKDITPSNADLIIYTTLTKTQVPEQPLDTQVYAYCFRLSDLGKRYYKLLRGCGYNIDFGDTRQVSLLPLMAYWRVYFEAYGVRHWKNFEETNLFGISNYLRSVASFNIVNSSAYFTNTDSILWKFFRDLGQMWYTDPVDWVSAHQAKVAEGFGTANSDIINYLNSGFIDIDGANGFSISGIDPLNPHLGYAGTHHGAMDDKLLKIAYRWVNRQDIIGGDIKAQLKAMGQGNVDDEIPVAFIGATSVDVPVNDVSSFADTFNATNDSGKLLGEFAGKGVKYDDGKTFTWKADKYGFWITMAVIVPEASFCQQGDARVRCKDRFSFYQPEFDGLGMEATSISDIVSCPAGSVQPGTSLSDDNNLADTFGYIPRASLFKIGRDVINGEFALNSKMDNFSPYHLDKVMNLGRIVLGATSTSAAQDGSYFANVVDGGNFFGVSQLPKAGTWWRYNSRYKWMANYNRIFVDSGMFLNTPIYGDSSGWSDTYADYTDMVVRNDDNFIVHNCIYVDTESPMKPIALTFETFDDEKGANGDAVKS